ncbi:MAG: hypothetical protein R3B13_26795 [Polyangiaceae bacterium]
MQDKIRWAAGFIALLLVACGGDDGAGGAGGGGADAGLGAARAVLPSGATAARRRVAPVEAGARAAVVAWRETPAWMLPSVVRLDRVAPRVMSGSAGLGGFATGGAREAEARAETVEPLGERAEPPAARAVSVVRVGPAAAPVASAVPGGVPAARVAPGVREAARR